MLTSRYIWKDLEIVLVDMTGESVLLVPSAYKPRMLLNPLKCTGWLPTRESNLVQNISGAEVEKCWSRGGKMGSRTVSSRYCPVPGLSHSSNVFPLIGGDRQIITADS